MYVEEKLEYWETIQNSFYQQMHPLLNVLNVKIYN